MKKSKKSSGLGLLSAILLVFLTFCAASCKDNDDSSVDTTPFNPSQEVVVTDFTPKDGGVNQKMLIFGQNFGVDTAMVKVTIGGKRAVVVNVKPTVIYCFVPAGAYRGDIQVTIGNSSTGVKTASAKETFKYERKMVLSTLCGKRNESGDDPWNPGSVGVTVPFSEATGFREDGFMKWDPRFPERLYVIYDNGGPGIQMLDMKRRTVQLVMSKAACFQDQRLRTIDFADDPYTGEKAKYMLVSTDRADNGQQSPSVWIVTRNYDGSFSNNSQRQVLASYKQCNGASIHPVNGELYFNSYESGQVFRLDMAKFFETQQEGYEGAPWSPYMADGAYQNIFRIQDNGWEFQIDIHPSGKYAYIVVINQHYILRSDYNEAEKRFSAPYVFAGEMGQTGWVEGVGTSARVNRPYQGCFVKNPEYVAAGREDVYDFYFCDNQNHCIRYLTPDGLVRTYAGRGTSSITDNNMWGTEDGDLREVARFRDPTGICYNEETNTFYILDTVGHRIRMISMEGTEENEQ